jgi:hypothetical protein
MRWEEFIFWAAMSFLIGYLLDGAGIEIAKFWELGALWP